MWRVVRHDRRSPAREQPTIIATAARLGDAAYVWYDLLYSDPHRQYDVEYEVDGVWRRAYWPECARDSNNQARSEN